MLANPHAPTHQAPEFPAGSHQMPAAMSADDLRRSLDAIAAQPTRLRYAVQGLSPVQMEMRYRNWTIRQIVHHLADSTANAYIRFKLTLTEDRPTVKPYNESDWARLPDSLLADHTLSLSLFEALMGRLAFMIRAASPTDLERRYWHPGYQKEYALWQVVALYDWHGSHHIGQIEWLRNHYRW
jgi:hypothetical protein